MRLGDIIVAAIVVIGLSWFFAITTLAEEKKVCVEFNGVEYCETTTVIKFGDKEIPIDDPLALLNSIGNSQVEKISLWDVYRYPPVIVELARQLNVTEDMLIYELRDSDESWAALYELVQIYKEAASELRTQHVDEETLDKLFSLILEDITRNIMEQLRPYAGEEI